MDQSQLNPQNGMSPDSKDNSQEPSQKEKQDQKELTFVDFVRPEFLIDSLLRGAKLSKLSKTLKLILQALLYMGISALALSLLFGGELLDWLRPGGRLVGLVIAVLIFGAVLWYPKNKISPSSMQNRQLIFLIIGILALAIIGTGLFYATRFASPSSQESATREEAVPLWTGLSWKEVSEAVKSQKVDGASLTRYDLALFGDTIPNSLSGSIKKDDAKAWISSIKHESPLKPGDYSSKWGGEYGFLQYYNDELTKAGFVTDREVLLPSGERTYVGDAEKLDQLIRTFVRIDGGKVKYVVLFKYSVDTDQCSDSEKNIFGTCNLNTEERYGVYYVSSSLDGGTADWKTYRNEKYGFKLTFPESWSGVNIEQRTEVDPLLSIFAWNGDGETLQGKIDGYHFGFETANGVRQDLLTIYVMPESMWGKISSREPIVVKIQEKSGYVYAYARGCFDCPDELLPARTDVQNVVASFRFND